ncbi:hypothetical protein [Natronococcus wangiae]|nr:hypothetical protein [Natronococcus sp. AD5]
MNSLIRGSPIEFVGSRGTEQLVTTGAAVAGTDHRSRRSGA